MSKRKTKCLLVLPLLLLLACCLAVTPMLAAEEEETAGSGVALIASDGTTTAYDTLAEAFAAAGEGDTIKLLEDATVEVSSKSDNGLYQVNADLTLDLGENTLTITNKRAFGVLSGTLTIKNGTIAYNASGDTTLAITRAGASFGADNVTFEAVDVEDGSKTSSLYLVYAAAGGDVTLTNCVIGNVSNAIVKDNGNIASITMTGCEFGSVDAVSGTNYKDYKIYIDITKADVLAADSSGLVKIGSYAK